MFLGVLRWEWVLVGGGGVFDCFEVDMSGGGGGEGRGC